MKRYLLIIVAMLALVSCKRENYDAGDGELSYMRADFVEAHTLTAGVLDYAMTDDGERVVFANRISCSWAEKGDTVYRALLYYKQAEGMAEGSPVAVSRVPVLLFAEPNDTVTAVTDPVRFESAWMSAGGKYLNIGFAIMTGRADGQDTRQTIGVVCDDITTGDDGHRVWHLTFYHAQNGVPEYYSSRMFASIPTKGIAKGDTISISINTYDGVVKKKFAL